MKNIVLKVPTAIFVVLVFLPLMILALQLIAEKELLEPKYYDVLSNIGSIVMSIWLFSIVDYFQSKAPDFKYTRLIYLLLILDFQFVVLDIAFDSLNFGSVLNIVLIIAQSAIFTAATVFITLLVRKVFYERAVWFIILEIISVIVGIITLTPEIKKHEKELLAKSLE